MSFSHGHFFDNILKFQKPLRNFNFKSELTKTKLAQKMKSFCFLKDCSNFNGDFDCILHYSKIVNEAQQKIIMHYNGKLSYLRFLIFLKLIFFFEPKQNIQAMRSRMEEVLNDNANYEEAYVN